MYIPETSGRGGSICSHAQNHYNGISEISDIDGKSMFKFSRVFILIFCRVVCAWKYKEKYKSLLPKAKGYALIIIVIRFLENQISSIRFR
jgi:hypothetical protein